MNAPVAVFAFRRPAHTQRLLQSLAVAEGADHASVHVFCDAARGPDDVEAVAEVRAVVRAARGFGSVEVIERDRNLGLSASILDGVGRLAESHRAVIVLEDDLIVAPGFLGYMNSALERHADEPRVMQVCGFMFPVEAPGRLPESFFLRQTTSWGWATWARAWRQLRTDPVALLDEIETAGSRKAFDLNGAYPYGRLLEAHARGAVSSWAVLWYASVFLSGGLCLWPRRTFVQNEGFDGSGTHGDRHRVASVPLWENSQVEFPATVSAHPDAKLQIERYLRQQRGGFAARVAVRLRSLIRAHAQG